MTKEPEVKRKLSKKKRKQLERLLDQKDKKSKRGELLERLSKLQVPTSELEQYKSIAHLGTNHSHKSLAKLPDKQFTGKINTVKGSKRKSKNNRDEENEEIEAEESEEVSTDEEEDEEMKTEENPSEDIIEDDQKPNEDHVRKRAREDSEDEESEVTKKPKLLGPKLKFVEVQRKEEIQNGRLELPILSEEGNILEAVNNNDVILICGETGSGKTTQVPQFLYEAG